MPLSPRAGAGLVAVGAEVQLTSDAALAFQLAKGHGGWAPPMADCLGRCGTIVDVVNSQGDVRVNCGEFGSYVWNPAAIVGPATRQEFRSVLALDLHPRRLFASTAARGPCSLCGSLRGGLSSDGSQSLAATIATTVPATPGANADFCSRDGAFRLCRRCAEPYQEPVSDVSSPPAADGDSSAASMPLDCPGRHGLSDIGTNGAAICDVCGRTLSSGEILSACRSCNWGTCPDCLRDAPAGARAPRFDVGSLCRVEWRGKTVRAVVVDMRGEPEFNEVLMHFPGHPADQNDEWIEVTSRRLVPLDPPAAALYFHPAHRSGLVCVRLPQGPERGPKCASEAKFPGGCRRFVALASGEPLPVCPTALYCEKTEFYLCPWCAGSDVVDEVSTPAGVQAANHADIAALRDPDRCADAATRVAQQCTRSVAALVGLLHAGAVSATSEALAQLASPHVAAGAIAAPSAASAAPGAAALEHNVAVDASGPEPVAQCALSHPVLKLFLDLAEWMFSTPSPPAVGDSVLAERGDTWHLAVVMDVQADAASTCVVRWADGGGLPGAQDTSAVRLEQLRRLCGTGCANSASMRQPRARQVHRHGVPPPAALARDFLIKKAIPADNTLQARQYLMDGADLAAVNDSGDGVLVLAVEHGCSPKMIRLLLEFGCPLSLGQTLGDPLKLAARYGQSENVELLINAKADPCGLLPDALPEHAARRIAPLAALLSISGGVHEAAASQSICLAAEKATLVNFALPPLFRLLARPPTDFAGSEDAEARLLKVLDSLLGASNEADDGGHSAAIACLEDLTELVQRLMTTYSGVAARGALLLTERLLKAGPTARERMAHCGILRFVTRLADPVDGCGVGGLPRSFSGCGGEAELGQLAQRVLGELHAHATLPCEVQIPSVAVNLLQLSTAIADAGAVSPQHQADVFGVLGELKILLEGDPGVQDVDPSALGITSFEIELGEIPQALMSLMDAGVVTPSVLEEQIGAKALGRLSAMLLRLVESTDELPVQLLPTYLCQPLGLRVLCEPMAVALLPTTQWDATMSLAPHRPEELSKHWLQVEPLLKVSELERVVLLTTPVLDRDFLHWCVGLVGQDVAFSHDPGQARTASPAWAQETHNSAVIGRVVGFRLATAMRLPIHTLRCASDGRDVDLVASVHGLAAVGPPPEGDAGANLRVALLRLEATTAPEDFGDLLGLLRRATTEKRTWMSRDLSVQAAVSASVGGGVQLPASCQETLRNLGFHPSGGNITGSVWELADECPYAALIGSIAEQRDVMGGDVSGESPRAGIGTQVEPDPDLVAQIAAIFPENGAMRACIAVNNSSVEAAMEWACQHQGDPDFNDPVIIAGRGGCAADPRAPVWSVFIVLPPSVPFDLVWPMLEEPVKGALTSVANAWTAMGWAGGEAEMRETLRAQVGVAGEGPIARGLVRAKAERVASRLKNACECRVEADPEGASHAPRGRAANASGTMASGARVQLVLEAEQLGLVIAAAESSIDVVTDDGRLLLGLPPDQVRLAQRPSAGAAGERVARPAGFTGSLQALLHGMQVDAGAGSLTSVAEPIGAPPPAPLQCTLEALDRGAQESDVVRRFQPRDLLVTPEEAGSIAGSPSLKCAPVPQQPAPVCRVAFSLVDRQASGIDPAGLCLLRGERTWVRPGEDRRFTSTAWVTMGIPGLAVSVGSWYYEVALTKFKNPQVGWADASFRFFVGAYSDDGVGDDSGSWAADGERCCLWHKGRAGEWWSAGSGQTLSCGVSIEATGEAQMWFAVDGAWDPNPVFTGALPDTYVYPAFSGELDAAIRLHAAEMLYGPPQPRFRPIGESQQATDTTAAIGGNPLVLPPHWTVLQGLYRMAEPVGLPDAPSALAVRAHVQVLFGSPTLQKQVSVMRPVVAREYDCTVASAFLFGDDEPVDVPATETISPLTLRRNALEAGLPLRLCDGEVDQALTVCGLSGAAARAALRLLHEFHASGLLGSSPWTLQDAASTAAVSPASASGVAAAAVAPPGGSGGGEEANESTPATAPAVTGSDRSSGSSRLGAKLGRHLSNPLACCAGAIPRWCRELPILTPWVFPLEAREALLRSSAFGITFAVRWLQERAVDERFAEKRRSAEERLAQAKHIGDAALLNSAYEALFELQGQIARDSEAWVGSLKSEIARVERDNILQQAERAMDLTHGSPCALELQFEGENGFGRAVTQGFYTLVAHELQRRAFNREVPIWVEDDPPLNEDFLRPRRGLLARPLLPDDPRMEEVERRFHMLGRLMAKALREGFVVPLPLTAVFFQMVLGGAIDPVSWLPQPGDGVSGEFLGACAAMVADAARGPATIAELAADPEWSQKYMQPPGEEPVPAADFDAYASAASFVESGLSGSALCADGESRPVTADNVHEFVQLASAFWLESGVERQLVAFRRGIYDVLGGGAVMLWAFSPAELRRLFCGEDEVVWTDKELSEHLYCGGGYSADADQVRWLRQEMLAMAQPHRAKFLEFVTSCPRLPPGGLKELQLSVHPDPADSTQGLPRSRACIHRLFLPRYASQEELARQLSEAILSSAGHHEQQLPL